MASGCGIEGVAAIGYVPEAIPDVSGLRGRDHRRVNALHRRFSRADFARPEDGRILGGVCVGLADTFGLDPNVVRCGFIVLTVASGFGILLYAAAWLAMPAADPDTRRRALRPGGDAVATGAFAAVVLGLLLVVRALGLWPGDVIVWPLAAAMAGLALLAMRTTPPEGASVDLPEWTLLKRLPPETADALAVLVGTRRGTLARVIVGVGLVIMGMIAFVVTAGSWSALRGALVASIVMIVGVALVVGPGVMRLVGAFVNERQERVRADERAEVAAHLHDSVLQTLALVQRRADDPREVVRLARLQERELRAWLLAGGTAPDAANGNDSLGGALEEIAASVETERGVPVEVVRVRDCPVDGMEPLLLAAREAIVNASHHSGAPAVSVYLEVEPDRATIFVRDRGNGFDTETVPGDRGGITNSISGRMTRAGGQAEIRSTLGEGTEVELELPRKSA
jgi:signal transduction histidine kinase/phage shock protein PspC (stress-responsive transcriptional regulator)